MRARCLWFLILAIVAAPAWACPRLMTWWDWVASGQTIALVKVESVSVKEIETIEALTDLHLESTDPQVSEGGVEIEILPRLESAITVQVLEAVNAELPPTLSFDSMIWLNEGDEAVLILSEEAGLWTSAQLKSGDQSREVFCALEAASALIAQGLEPAELDLSRRHWALELVLAPTTRTQGLLELSEGPLTADEQAFLAEIVLNAEADDRSLPWMMRLLLDYEDPSLDQMALATASRNQDAESDWIDDAWIAIARLAPEFREVFEEIYALDEVDRLEAAREVWQVAMAPWLGAMP